MLFTWPVLALIFSFFGAAIIHANHVFKLDGFIAVFIRGFILLLIGLPLSLYLGAPQEQTFYIFAAAAGVIITVADILLMNASATHGGRLTALYIPLKIFFLFFLWGLLEPTSITGLSSAQLITILACFTLTAMALLNFRRSDASMKALFAVIPIALLFTGADVFAKEAISTSNLIGSALIFLSVSGIIAAVLSGGWIKFHRKQSLLSVCTKDNIIGATVMGLILMVGVPIMLSAIALAPNPAYVGAITILASVWLTIYYKVSRGDDASLTASMVMIISAIVLTLVTA